VRSAAAGAALLLATAGVARADDLGRAALSMGAAQLYNGPSDLEPTGLHVGVEAALHLGFVGPMLSLDVDRFGGAQASVPPTWLVAMGAGLRGFLVRARWPVALFLDAQGVVAGTTNPLAAIQPCSALARCGSSFLGGAAGAGLEWPGPITIALGARYLYLADGPQLVTFSLVVGFGAP